MTYLWLVPRSLSPRSNWDSPPPTPSPASVFVPLQNHRGGGDTLACGWGGERIPIRTTFCKSMKKYIYFKKVWFFGLNWSIFLKAYNPKKNLNRQFQKSDVYRLPFTNTFLLVLEYRISIKSRLQKIEIIVGPGETEISWHCPFPYHFGDN